MQRYSGGGKSKGWGNRLPESGFRFRISWNPSKGSYYLPGKPNPGHAAFITTTIPPTPYSRAFLIGGGAAIFRFFPDDF